jgi:hypothetical protein
MIKIPSLRATQYSIASPRAERYVTAATDSSLKREPLAVSRTQWRTLVGCAGQRGTFDEVWWTVQN